MTQLKLEENVVDSLTIGTFNFNKKDRLIRKKKKKWKSSESTQC